MPFPYSDRDWSNVPEGTIPPPGAPIADDAWFEAAEDSLREHDAHQGAVYAVHGGVVVYVGDSTVPPVAPPNGLPWFRPDTDERVINTGTAVAPVWDQLADDVYKLTAADFISDYVISGLLPLLPSPASLTATIPSGAAYVVGKRIVKSAEPRTFTGARDTYVDIDDDGIYVNSVVLNGAAIPAIPAGTIRLFKIVADASVAQVSTVTVTTAVNSTIYTATINGVPITYTSDATATLAEIAAGLAAAINASVDVNVTPVTAAYSSGATFTVMADVAGVGFTIAVGTNLSVASTTPNYAARITGITDLRDTTPTVNGVAAATSVDWNTGIDNKPATFPPDTHNFWSTKHPDVDAADTPANGDVATFDSASGKWKASPPTGGSGGGAVAAAVPVIAMGSMTAEAIWTNQPAGLEEIFGNAAAFFSRTQVDLANATQARIVAQVSSAGAAAAELRAQYSADNGATWNYLDGTDGPKVGIGSSGTRAGAWVNLASGAKADVRLRLVGISGNATADPSFLNIRLVVK